MWISFNEDVNIKFSVHDEFLK